MNNEEFKSSKSATEEESQPSPPEEESPVTETEPRQKSPPSRSDTREVPGNEADSSSSEGEYELVSPEPSSPLTISDVKKLNKQGWVTVADTNKHNSDLQFPTAGSSSEREQQISVFRPVDSMNVPDLKRISVDMLRKALEHTDYLLPSKDIPARTYWNEWLSDVPLEVLEEILKGMVILPEPHRRSILALENAPSTSLRDRPSIPASKMVPFNISANFREICETSKPETSSSIRYSQPSSSAFDNGIHESQTKSEGQKNADDPKLGEDSLPPEVMERELIDALKDLDLSPEQSSESSSEGSPIKKSENHSK